MLKNLAKLEYKIGDRTFQFLCDQDSPLQDCHEALSQFVSHVLNLARASQASEKQEFKAVETEVETKE